MMYTYSGILLNVKKKKKEILTHVETWMNFENVMLSGISQSQTDKWYMVLLV